MIKIAKKSDKNNEFNDEKLASNFCIRKWRTPF